MTDQGVGASILRKEDDRLMRGRGQFVADLRFAGLRDVAFVRSPLAHGLIRGIAVPDDHKGSVFTAADLDGVKPIRAVSGLRGFKVSDQPSLAVGKVRYVGELVAMCVAPTRAEAEDIAGTVDLDLDELPAVYEMLAARDPTSALLHEHWGDNVFLETFVDVGIEKVLDAPIKVTREIRTARQCMAPIEGRGVLAEWDPRLEQMVVTTSTQMPHVTRTGLADCLGLDEGQVRIVSPDVGGGFGYKGILLPEEIVCAAIARLLGRQVAADMHVLDGLEGEIRVDGLGPVAGQARKVMHLAGLAGFDDEADRGPQALADQVVVHRRRGEERRDRDAVRADHAV